MFKYIKHISVKLISLIGDKGFRQYVYKNGGWFGLLFIAMFIAMSTVLVHVSKTHPGLGKILDNIELAFNNPLIMWSIVIVFIVFGTVIKSSWKAHKINKGNKINGDKL